MHIAFRHVSIICVCGHRVVNIIVTMLAMTAAGVNLGIMEKIVVNHRFSLDYQLLLTLMRIGRSSLTFFVRYLLMTLAMLSF